MKTIKDLPEHSRPRQKLKTKGTPALTVMKRVFCALFLLTCTASALAAGADWQPIATHLLKRENTGFGGLCGVFVDHQSGDPWVSLRDRGMFHSSDQGKTWKRGSAAQP